MFGWDMGRLGAGPNNLDSVPFANIQEWIKEVYRRGGVNTISWHFDNFLDGGDSWSTGPKVVTAILPGGEAHKAYLQKLDAFADFVNELRVGLIIKRKVPVIFRPFHEHTGSWFWWGKGHCSAEEYQQLWRFTFHYLHDEKGLDNLLWSYSPDRFKDKADYLECYPGDGYVDILGVDDYHHAGLWWKQKDFLRRLRETVELAEERGKIAALTETGSEAISHAKWWTEKFLHPILNDPVASRIAWVLVWRNDNPKHHYGPYPGHKSEVDFLAFSDNERVLFLEELTEVYRIDQGLV